MLILYIAQWINKNLLGLELSGMGLLCRLHHHSVANMMYAALNNDVKKLILHMGPSADYKHTQRLCSYTL